MSPKILAVGMSMTLLFGHDITHYHALHNYRGRYYVCLDLSCKPYINLIRLKTLPFKLAIYFKTSVYKKGGQ